MSSRIADTVLTAATVLMLLLAGVVALRPEGIVGREIKQFRDHRRQVGAIRALWNEMTEGNLVAGSRSTVGAIEFGDYECPYCRLLQDSVDNYIRASSNSTVGLVFAHYPLSNHLLADGAARTAICANRQGFFVPMHHYLMSTDEWQDSGDWEAVAVEVGVPDVDAFRRCLVDSATDEELAENRRWAEELGVTSTPTLVTPGGVVVGVTSMAELLD